MARLQRGVRPASTRARPGGSIIYAMDAIDGLIRSAALVCAALCLPVLVAATLAGTVVAVLQAATQVQEQTLSLLPKLIVVGLVVAVGGAFGMRLCAQLFTDAITRIPALLSG